MPVRQQDIQNPHFSVPFRFGGVNGGAFMNGQDTGDDIIDCVKAIIAYNIGDRQDLPEFGIPELLFQVYDEVTIDQVRTAVMEWEERAVIDVDGAVNLTDDMILNILVSAGVTGGMGRSSG